MRKPDSGSAHRDIERVRLSKSFLMRNFLVSVAAVARGLNNVPYGPDMAIAAGSRLCKDRLEPLLTSDFGTNSQIGGAKSEITDAAIAMDTGGRK